jgi:phosphoribosyl 1,2-cyclic phosphodiesterase
MHVFFDGGILAQDGLRMAALDPPRSREDAIVSHGHMDHLSSGAVMTPETLDVLKVRRPRSPRFRDRPHGVHADFTYLRMHIAQRPGGPQ